MMISHLISMRYFLMMKYSDSHFLLPSTLFVSREEVQVLTVLGSCIAVCLWDRKENFGGINHYMLPLWNGQGLASPKYGNIAIEKLIEKMELEGAKREHLVAKIFGGAEVLNLEQSLFDIPQRNINIAYELIGRERIPIVSSSTGGKKGRKIIYNTLTGMVAQKYLGNKEPKG